MLNRILFVFILVFLSGNTSGENVGDGIVEFRNDLIPSCFIKFDESYWGWRDSVGVSSDLERDISLIYGLISAKIKHDGTDVNVLNYYEKALCSYEVLFSPELAKIMNYFGGNVSPHDLYFNLTHRISQFGNDSTLGVNCFSGLLRNSISELEARFVVDE